MMLPASKSCLTFLIGVNEDNGPESLPHLTDNGVLVMSKEVLCQSVLQHVLPTVSIKIIVLQTPPPPASSCDVWSDVREERQVSKSGESPQTPGHRGVGGGAVEVDNIGEQGAAEQD